MLYFQNVLLSYLRKVTANNVFALWLTIVSFSPIIYQNLQHSTHSVLRRSILLRQAILRISSKNISMRLLLKKKSKSNQKRNVLKALLYLRNIFNNPICSNNSDNKQSLSFGSQVASLFPTFQLFTRMSQHSTGSVSCLRWTNSTSCLPNPAFHFYLITNSPSISTIEINSPA